MLEAVLALACGCGPKAADALEPRGKALRKHVHDAQASFATSPDFTEWAEHPLRKSDKALEVAAKPK